MKLIKKIEVSESGSICIEFNKPIESKEEEREFFEALEKKLKESDKSETI